MLSNLMKQIAIWAGLHKKAREHQQALLQSQYVWPRARQHRGWKARSKFGMRNTNSCNVSKPHQGKREMARRVLQDTAWLA